MNYTVKISRGKAIGLFVLFIAIVLLAYYSRGNKNSPDFQIPFAKAASKEFWNLFPC